MLRKMIERYKKGYCREDLWSIDGWFMDTFPNMLRDFSKNTICVPITPELQKDAHKLPIEWVEQQELNDIFSEEDCWKLIILRMAYCFEHLNEFHEDYQYYWDNAKYAEKNKIMMEYKKEAFKLFEKYFFNLWW